MEVMDFLRGWLTNHILGTDAKYGKFIQPSTIQ
jgi:hemerythrin